MKLLIVGAAAFSAMLAYSQEVLPGPPSPERVADVKIVGHIVKPTELPAPKPESLKVPKGFKVERFAEGVGNARILAIVPDGSVYVTRREQADVLKYKVGKNGLAEGGPVRVAARNGLHGIAFKGNKVFLATVHEIFTAEVKADGTFGPLDMIIHDLPDAGQHNTRTVQVGPDDMLYIGVGSTCNECAEPNPENATILRASLDGKSRSIFASGLRDPIGWAWHPVTGELWGMDHGIDWLGDDVQPEELNKIEKGKNYGWPYYFADNQVNPHLDPASGVKKSELKKTSVPMVLGYKAHSAPMQMTFYTGKQFPASYRNSAFISMRGSWNRKPASGYEIVQIKFKDGKATGFEPFVTGFLSDKGQSARPVGNAVAADGSLLFTDDRVGIIYRVSYQGNEQASKEDAGKTPDEPMLKQNRVGVKTPLAQKILESKGLRKLEVSTPAFKSGGEIPKVYTAYEQNFSVPLNWGKGPEGTKSYAILMEDPDATITPLPVVHWMAWNIVVEALPEGIPGTERPADFKPMQQGLNFAGKFGYMGSRPPEGEPAHNYHFQVFALDTQLDLPIATHREQLLEAMKGHVLAFGETVGKFARPDKPSKP